MKKPLVNRFIPNSAPGIREEMLKVTGYNNVEEIYEEIPEKLRFKGQLQLPKKPKSELEVERAIKTKLNKNKTTQDYLSFLGAGCWPHYSPALCEEITGRSEFLTAYAGGDMTDYGRYHTLFEYQSMMGDLLSMDIVSIPVYDGTTAAGDALHIASRATNRREVLIPGTMSPNTLATMTNYADPWLSLKKVDYDLKTGLMDIDDLKRKLTPDTAAVFIENPSYLGFVEEQCQEIGELAHAAGALLISYVNPISLGIFAAPGDYGADIACGEGQPLGLKMNCGGAAMGILAVNDAERFIELMPSWFVGIGKTSVDGEYAFSRSTLSERLIYTTRHQARSFTGTSSWLWGISAAVYLALMGPQGMQRLARTNIERSQYLAMQLKKIPGIKAPYFSAMHFNELVVNFDNSGKTADEINQALFKQGILAGKDISQEFPALGQSLLVCVTETHTKADIDQYVEALKEILL